VVLRRAKRIQGPYRYSCAENLGSVVALKRELDPSNIDDCEEVLQLMAKSVNAVPQSLSEARSSRPFELIYSDLSGKQSLPSYGNAQYYIIFIDDFTRMGWIYFLKNKSPDAGQII